MSTEPACSLMNQGTTKTYKLPIEHLDYNFVEKCTDVKYLEKILIVLRSGEEGLYPDLISFCEKKIEKLDPKNRILRTNNPPATAASFTKEEWQEITSDIKSWTDEMKQKENEVKYRKPEVECFDSENHAPIRGANASVLSHQNDLDKKKSTDRKRVIPRDYREWDKFDVEKECAKIDEGKQKISSTTIINDGISGIGKGIDTTGMTDQEKMVLADREKDKGNEAFRAGDHKEAVLYYTRSISVIPNVTAFNNRAQAEIKLQNWKKALHDVEKVLELEPGNLKALLRRATVHKHLANYQAATDDLKRVLQAEPNNPIAKKLLQEVEQKLKDSQPIGKMKKKGKRMLIKEVEGSDDEKEGKFTNENKDSSKPVGGRTSKAKAAMGNSQKKCSHKRESQTNEKNRAKGKDTGGAAAQKNTKKDSDGNSTALKETEPSKCGHETKGENVENVTIPMASKSQDPPRIDSGQMFPPGSGSETEKGKNNTWALPPAVAKLKSEGNKLFKNGQFGDAVIKYTKAITELIESGVDCPAELSILHSNQAACYLKDGNCIECIKDCTRALELQPFSVKPLLRRAMAYEALERYRQAYVDYKTVLQVDSRIQLANDSINRLTKTLIEEDGTKWREKLSPIPVVPISAHLHRWEKYSISSAGNETQTTKENQYTSPDHGKNVEENFISLKQEANSFVKKTQYKEAIAKYSECLKLKSNDCTIYTNRALCFLKLNQYKKAEEDCNSALQLEPTNVKAFYRRALAYKGLKCYTSSIEDLNKLLKLDSNVAEAQKELLEVSKLLKQEGKKTSNQEKIRKDILIQEDSDEEEENTTVTASGQKTATDPKAVQVDSAGSEDPSTRREAFGNSNPPPEKGANLMPTNAYEFGQALSLLQAKKDITACAELLKNVEPKDLPSLMSNKLEGDVFTMIIQALKGHLLEKDPNLVYQYLVHLCKTERFKMVSVLVGKEREQVQQLFSCLLQTKSDHFTSEDVQNLAKNYI
ncbi:sperm-associated antigen 1-like isoform X1 [Scyliorhinus canicula]|uniref:sperm-associated antigen 1-like isoform X1 n=1 Tax=Scyliorhinus canicula TaxID=7830 RepID=UPI0018F53C73|nr:sperm-associated antigen 1-like isoform X1 [Scyliorhinus canicula]XP_038666024.1 sperm-associated antigen 1-like isoform X1 [Scyliorhinus canicula]XP_038666025.1 sperm-associated antigen 1-like isoform X1 [Scyliorhinus canicula]XP_038666026.1 sperm-associated antigen 1-like isoform X1 [Scyliorhinus canicula]XP_038666027.1 sperm-associated antigen 1-like isoform X1 [Scyliorhinus canicula]